MLPDLWEILSEEEKLTIELNNILCGHFFKLKNLTQVN